MSTPVRITFSMRTPMVVPSVDKALDSLLSWAAVQKAEFEDAPDPIASQHDIGLTRHHCADQWCFMASNVSIEWLGNATQEHYIKRSKLEDYVKAWDDGLLVKRPAFDGQRGLTKAGSYLVPLRWASTVTAFAVVEDMERVKELLPWVISIGKLGHKDRGGVREFSIVEDESASDLWRYRNLPFGSPAANGHIAGVGALVSPYWRRDNHKIVAFSPK